MAADAEALVAMLAADHGMDAAVEAPSVHADVFAAVAGGRAVSDRLAL